MLTNSRPQNMHSNTDIGIAKYITQSHTPKSQYPSNPKFEPHPGSTNLFVYGFPPTGGGKATPIVKILIAHHIQTKTSLKIVNIREIRFIKGKVWDEKRCEFDTGKGANIVVEGILSQSHINEINGIKKTEDIYHLKYYLSDKKLNDHQKISIVSGSYGKTLSETSNKKLSNNKNTLMESHKYIPPPLRSKILPNTTKSPLTNDKNLTKKYDKKLDDKTLYNPSLDQERPNLNSTNTALYAIPPDTKFKTILDDETRGDEHKTHIALSISKIKNGKKLHDTYADVNDATSYSVSGNTILNGTLTDKITITRNAPNDKDPTTYSPARSSIDTPNKDANLKSHPIGKKSGETIQQSNNKNDTTKKLSDKKSRGNDNMDENINKNTKKIDIKYSQILENDIESKTNNYAIMRALTHYLYYSIHLGIILSTLSYKNNKIISNERQSVLLSHQNGKGSTPVSTPIDTG